MAKPGLSTLGEVVRRHDPDRFFTALFAPPEHRETLLLLYAFNHELARANEVTREPVAALIRLQWWREVVEGAARRHEVAEPLRRALDDGRLRPAELLRMIEAREMEAEGIETTGELEAALLDGAGGLMVAAGEVLEVDGAEALRLRGAGYGAVTALRNMVGHVQRSLPGAAFGSDEVAAGWLVDRARGWLVNGTALARSRRAAVLPAVLARRKLGRWDGTSPALRTRLSDRLAVVWSAYR